MCVRASAKSMAEIVFREHICAISNTYTYKYYTYAKLQGRIKTNFREMLLLRKRKKACRRRKKGRIL